MSNSHHGAFSPARCSLAKPVRCNAVATSWAVVSDSDVAGVLR